MGIIDILTYFGGLKTIEYLTKSVAFCSQQMSCVPPDKYKKRFIDFISKECFKALD
jgi:hypothetical protein